VVKYLSGPVAFFWLFLGLGGGVLLSMVSPYFGGAFLAMAAICGVLWLKRDSISRPHLEKIRNGLEVSIVNVVADASLKQAKITFGIRNKYGGKLKIRAIDRITIRLNRERIIAQSLDAFSLNNPWLPRCEMVELCAQAPIRPEDMEFLKAQKGKCGIWDFTMDIHLDSHWGEVTRSVSDLALDGILSVATYGP